MLIGAFARLAVCAIGRLLDGAFLSTRHSTETRRAAHGGCLQQDQMDAVSVTWQQRRPQSRRHAPGVEAVLAARCIGRLLTRVVVVAESAVDAGGVSLAGRCWQRLGTR